ncbi:MAG: hypothetical protein CVV64_01910 [Candidatus Wallbacteria bacterium HGW-Wallbacteria-1]|jgi:hypothetical protein|uniref:UPF0235 protein CVV64_01910 n=1 Tax=Candidatus Wallbacteria bacterium HGW-Wallbacteria-1 TaxID=2013854 RepID=A0A2N1PV28_9BACT|nr:MAG: hypothetical protein CVV64_01910 [Candidatus Wallbacteria bacterium HGW-Wallbacteria-1]
MDTSADSKGHGEDAILEVKATPRASSNALKGFRNNVLLIQVTAAPDRNRANEELIKLLAKTIGIPKSRITILRGHTSRNKTLSISGMSLAEIERILEKQ